MQRVRSRASRLLSVIAVVAVAALPAVAGWRPQGDYRASRYDAPAVRASLSLLAPAVVRTAPPVISQRRSHPGLETALASSAPRSSNAPVAATRARARDERLVAAWLTARGYDATAPPLS